MNEKRLYTKCKDTTFALHMKTCMSKTHLSAFAACPEMCARMLETWCYASLKDALLKKEIKEDAA
jgi:hypothetical protein